MSLREFVPGLGDRTARARLKQLQDEALALDVVAALSWTKWIEQNVGLASGQSNPRAWAAWLLVAVVVTIWWVYQQRLREAADAATDAVGGPP